MLNFVRTVDGSYIYIGMYELRILSCDFIAEFPERGVISVLVLYGFQIEKAASGQHLGYRSLTSRLRMKYGIHVSRLSVICMFKCCLYSNMLLQTSLLCFQGCGHDVERGCGS